MVLEALLAGIVGVLLLVAFILLWRLGALRRQLVELAFAKQSQSVKYGKLTEQFMPFLKEYPYDPQRFRFLGTPIDGVQFNEDSIVFVEFKAGKHALSEPQREVKELVERKRVRFEEFRVEESTRTASSS